MKLSVSAVFWKYALLTLSILISLVGVALMSCGVIALGGAGSVTGAYIVTAIGCLVLSLCFLGCFASLRESYLLSMLFLGVGVVTIVLQTVFMITFAAMKSELRDDFTDRIDNQWEKVAEDESAMDGIQMQYYCCGKDSPQDYSPDGNGTLPDSCCLDLDCSIDGNIFPRGCASRVITFFDNQSDNLILTTLGLIALEGLAVVSAYYLCKCVKNVVHKTEQIVISE